MMLSNSEEFQQDNLRKAREAFQARKFEKALDCFPKIDFTNIPPEQKTDLLHQWAVSFHETGDQKQAQKKLKELLAIQPDHVPALITYGDWLADEGNPHGAISKYRAAAKANPEQWEPYYRWGFLLKRLGSSKAALRKFLIALGKNPEHWEGYVHAGDCAFQLGRYKQALQYYEKGLRFKEQSPEILCRLGKAHQALGNRQQAITAYQACIALKPQDGEGYENWGMLLFHEGKFPEAAAKYGEGLLHDPNSPTLLLRLGETLTQLGKLQQAIQPLEKALKILEGEIGGEWGLQWASLLSDCAYTLGYAHKQMGATDTAKQYFKTALRYIPNHGSSLQQLAMFHGVYREHHVAWEFVLEGRVEGRDGEMKGLRAYRVAALTMEEALGYVQECEEEIKGNLKAKDITRTEQVAAYAGVLARGPLFLLSPQG